MHGRHGCVRDYYYRTAGLLRSKRAVSAVASLKSKRAGSAVTDVFFLIGLSK